MRPGRGPNHKKKPRILLLTYAEYQDPVVSTPTVGYVWYSQFRISTQRRRPFMHYFSL
jgi:hypothetical protein